MTLQVIVGGQFGSEGKGAIAAHLAAELPDLLAVRVAGPNAGHTVIGRCPPGCELTVADGDWKNPRPGLHPASAHPWRLRQVPVAAVSNEEAQLAIAPGSEVDPFVLLSEVDGLNSAGYRVSDRLLLDYSATVIEEHHRAMEYANRLTDSIGSTGKGIGAARAERIWRSAVTVDKYSQNWPCETTDVGEHLRHRLGHHGNVQIEGTQGYGLGLHTGYYPYTTSSDCTAIDFMAMAGCPPWLAHPEALQVWVVFRTYPIRVAGNSGPMKHETTWELVGQPEEHTTVTQKVRRVAMWDPELARKAMEANGHRQGAGRSSVWAALTMADYVVPALKDTSQAPLATDDQETSDQFDQMVARYSKDIGSLVRLVGTGPASLIDLRFRPARRATSPSKEFMA